MHNELGHAGGAGGEVAHQHIVIANLGHGEIGRGVFDAGIVIQPAFLFAAHLEDMLQAGALRHGILHLLLAPGIIGGDDGLDIRRIDAVDDIFGSQLHACGDDDHAHSVAGNGGDPVLPIALEQGHDAVALLQAQRRQVVGRLLGKLGNLLKSEFPALAAVVEPDKGALGFVGLCPRIHNIPCKIEFFRHIQLVIFLEVRIRIERRAGKQLGQQHSLSLLKL